VRGIALYQKKRAIFGQAINFEQ